MTRSLVRFGLAIEASLLEELDRVVADRGCTRSELLRDLVRAEVTRDKIRSSINAVATLTIVYDHHVRELSEKLTEIQHQLGAQVHSTLHVHLNHSHCLEVIVMRGKSRRLIETANRIISTRGVIHGSVEVLAEPSERHAHSHKSNSK